METRQNFCEMLKELLSYFSAYKSKAPFNPSDFGPTVRYKVAQRDSTPRTHSRINFYMLSRRTRQQKRKQIYYIKNIYICNTVRSSIISWLGKETSISSSDETACTSCCFLLTRYLARLHARRTRNITANSNSRRAAPPQPSTRENGKALGSAAIKIKSE